MKTNHKNTYQGFLALAVAAIIIATSPVVCVFAQDDQSVLDSGIGQTKTTEAHKATAVYVIQSQINNVGHEGGIIAAEIKDRARAERDKQELLNACKAGIDALNGKKFPAAEGARYADILMESAKRADHFESKSPACVLLAKKVAVSYRLAAAALTSNLVVEGQPGG